MTRKMFTRLLLLAVLCAVVSSAVLPALEADHDCSGEDCPVCLCLYVCVNALKLLVPARFAAGEVMPADNFSFLGEIPQQIRDNRSDLVALRVKLSR